jgi:hypothetical protein
MGGVFTVSCFLRWDGRSVYCELFFEVGWEECLF